MFIKFNRTIINTDNIVRFYMHKRSERGLRYVACDAVDEQTYDLYTGTGAQCEAYIAKVLVPLLEPIDVTKVL